jgi:hypothetical protein
MKVSHSHLRLVRVAVNFAIMYVFLLLALHWGVETKSLWQRSWEFFTGGFLGIGAGIAFFFIVGAIGWVSGPVYGAVGLFGLMSGGALGGMGLGALVNIIRNPDHYNHNIPVILIVLVIGVLVARAASSFACRKLTQAANPQSQLLDPPIETEA